MIVIDVLVILVVAIVLITAVVSMGGPVAHMLASKTRYKYDALGSEAEVLLKKRLANLEEEVRQLRQQLLEVKDSTDFAVKMLEESGADTTRRISSAPVPPEEKK